MIDLNIDIEKAIKVLLKRYGELRKLRINPHGPTADDKFEQREQIVFLLADIDYKITILEIIAAHRSTAIVVVSRPTQTEIDTIKTALTNLNVVISREQTFDETVKTVTTILEAVDAVKKAAK